MLKGLMVFIVVTATIAVFYLMKASAGKARKTSNSILDEFKTIDKDLKKSTAVIDSANARLFDSLAK
jgi:hypothetical protein